ncbi:MAG: aminoacetone oxidase family FAD-binding enzyme [Campylobacteraceae bacterium]|nr:aminoacetone oxidase family FAD-binding enzyme [Campylobacteraceae bacterium]
MIYDIVIIGAGASGLMLGSLLNKNLNTCLIDTNKKIGAKIKVSGGAKCNITNEVVTSDNYLGESTFVQNILNQFSSSDMLKFCKKNGLETVFNEKLVKGTYFCKSSNDVNSMFAHLNSHNRTFLNTEVLDIEYKNHYIIKTSNQTIEAKKIVIASGAISFRTLGASSIAFDIAEKFSHKVSRLDPALVGFTVQKDQFWFKELSGVSLEVRAKVEHKEFLGGMLFAHKGLTGPIILNSSLYWKKGLMHLDFLPHNDLKPFFKSNKKISSALPLVKRFIVAFLESVNLEDKAISSLNEEEKEKLYLLKHYAFAPAGNFGYTKAEVTKGGILTEQINDETMMSKIQKDMYFIGECLDVTGELGGFNFQFAWSSAFVCAKSLNKN